MKENYFKGKSILITGASSGLGRELAIQSIRKGAHVIAMARNKEKLEELKNEIGSDLPLQISVCDVSNRLRLKEVLEEIIIKTGTPDIVVLNAGVKDSSNFGFSSQKILATFGVNFNGPIFCLETLLPAMTERGKGQIVFISSMGGYHGMVHANGYNASKAALSIFADSLRIDLRAQNTGIKVTVVKPGFIATAMMPKGGLSRRLSVQASTAARKILRGIARQKKQIVFPLFMYLLSLIMASLPKGAQQKLFMKLAG